MIKRTTREKYVFNRSGYGEGHEKAANTSWSKSEGENIKRINTQANQYIELICSEFF